MYLMKFDEEGKKISAVPWVLADDWGGVEKLKNEGYIEVSDEDWNYYTGNCGDGDNDTGYIRDSITGKPISAPARVIKRSKQMLLKQNMKLRLKQLMRQYRLPKITMMMNMFVNCNRKDKIY